MRRILLSLVATGMAVASFAQSIVHGVSPQSIATNFEFTLGETSFGPNNFNTTLTIAEAIFVEDGTTGTDANGHPLSQRGCNTITNAADVAGKIALVSRGECDFGLKALNAQTAGAVAVIIVNNQPGMVNMQGGNSGTQVTIPTVFISFDSGNLLRDALEEGPITLMLGKKLGYFANDLTLRKPAILTPRYMVHNPLLSGAQTADVGMKVFNEGQSTVSDYYVRLQVLNSANEVVYADSTAGISVASGDSVTFNTGGTNNFPQFNANLPEGNYKLVYSIVNAGDLFATDNTFSFDYSVSNYAWSIVNHLVGTSINEDNSGIRPADQVATEQLFCNQYSHPNASAVALKGFRAGFSTTASTMEGKSIAGYVYSWDNVFANIDDANLAIDNLQQIGFGEYFFDQNAANADAELMFEDVVYLNDNQRYLVCIGSLDTSLYYSFSTARDVAMNLDYELEAYCPQLTGQWYLLGFGSDYTAVIALEAVDAATAGLNKTELLEGKAFPNPVNDYVRLQVAKDGAATVTVTDLAGRTVSTQELGFASNIAILDMTNATSGMYIINVVYNDGARAKFNVVKN